MTWPLWPISKACPVPAALLSGARVPQGGTLECLSVLILRTFLRERQRTWGQNDSQLWCLSFLPLWKSAGFYLLHLLCTSQCKMKCSCCNLKIKPIPEDRSAIINITAIAPMGGPHPTACTEATEVVLTVAQHLSEEEFSCHSLWFLVCLFFFYCWLLYLCTIENTLVPRRLRLTLQDKKIPLIWHPVHY